MSNHARLLHLDNPSKRQSKRQCGQALLAMLVIMVIGLSAAIYALVSPTRSTVERDKITTAALAQAKAALIGYAVGVSDLAGNERPGDLPCPDLNDGGSPGAQWTGNCNTPSLRIGRLPWKHLGLPDLRDGDGERLWYAVSDNFKNNNRTACTSPGAAGCLNSDSRGTITIRNSEGVVINKGIDPDPMGIDPTPYAPSGIIAVIFAPGAVLQRQDGTSQVRDCSGAGCVVATGVCNSAATAKCNPVNYLDILNGVEDNADFIDRSNTNGFINGKIRSASGDVIVNDRLLTITYEDLMPVLQRRVAREALNSLIAYASANNGRYPWAAPITDVTSPYSDNAGERFGRIPDNLSETLLGLGGSAIVSTVCTLLPALCMSTSFPTAATINKGSWWMNWKEHVFYGVAEAYAPAMTGISIIPPNVFIPTSGGCGNCLLVDPPSAVVDKRVAVVVAGKRLSGVNGGQPRSSTGNKQDPANYLEGTNVNGSTSYTYEQQPTSNSFNDIVLYQ